MEQGEGRTDREMGPSEAFSHVIGMLGERGDLDAEALKTLKETFFAPRNHGEILPPTEYGRILQAQRQLSEICERTLKKIEGEYGQVPMSEYRGLDTIRDALITNKKVVQEILEDLENSRQKLRALDPDSEMEPGERKNLLYGMGIFSPFEILVKKAGRELFETYEQLVIQREKDLLLSLKALFSSITGIKSKMARITEKDLKKEVSDALGRLRLKEDEEAEEADPRDFTRLVEKHQGEEIDRLLEEFADGLPEEEKTLLLFVTQPMEEQSTIDAVQRIIKKTVQLPQEPWRFREEQKEAFEQIGQIMSGKQKADYWKNLSDQHFELMAIHQVIKNEPLLQKILLLEKVAEQLELKKQKKPFSENLPAIVKGTLNQISSEIERSGLDRVLEELGKERETCTQQYANSLRKTASLLITRFLARERARELQAHPSSAAKYDDIYAALSHRIFLSRDELERHRAERRRPRAI